MNITVKLSDQSIRDAIRALRNVQDHLRWGLDDTVQILAKEGAMIARSAYGDMANVVDYMQDEAVGIIATSGKANIIAEFGAGDATEVPTGFENMPYTPVYPGSYSESEDGAGMYAKLGWWRFGGKVYTQVEPRHGLMRAKAYIVASSTDVAKEVIKL